ncbi:MAG: 4,5-DOPA dioxygenase extradiol [Chitinophagaceae bacterium]|nr:4,5-DOPA dioxygenase extradiol [Chitinophagaceae bacterium]
MQANALQSLSNTLHASPRMPLLFLGHGSPMNAIEDNVFVRGFKQMALKIPIPQAILCISAHWETKGTQVTAMEHPKTIHDFGGFPRVLYEVQYPAPGSPNLAHDIQTALTPQPVNLNYDWGLDHGAWSVIKHLYPLANIPVIQLSLDVSLSPEGHYRLAQQLATLRRKGVLIIGSGNMVHNLGMVAWDKLNAGPFGYDWALEARHKMNKAILEHDHKTLIDFRKQGRAFDLAIPTPEHYLPLLYILALQEKNEHVEFFNDEALAGSLTMTSLKIDAA